MAAVGQTICGWGEAIDSCRYLIAGACCCLLERSVSRIDDGEGRSVKKHTACIAIFNRRRCAFHAAYKEIIGAAHMRIVIIIWEACAQPAMQRHQVKVVL